MFSVELSRFQITHPYGVRPSSRCPMWQWCLFQFTHPYGVRPAVAAALNVKYRFNSRTHIGRDAASAYVPLSRSLSFNSRTHMGCDTGAITRLSSSTRFNSRTHMGCDRYYKDRINDPEEFQFTHPYGVRRQNGAAQVGATVQFQFTHPYGVRHNDRRHGPGARSFNSRTHMGCDPIRSAIRSLTFVSIHAPIWGATSRTPVRVVPFRFQFTHPYGVRHVKEIRADMETQVSIHAPIWGATPYGLAPGDEFSAFQFTHPYGVRPTITFTLSVHYRFNSRTHMGCDYIPGGSECLC